MSSLARQSTQIVTISCIGYILQYLCHLYMTHSMSAGEYGNFAVAVSMAFFLSMVVELGASKTLPKYVHHYQQHNDTQRLSGLLRGYFSIIVLLSALVISAGYVLGYFELSLSNAANKEDKHPLILVLWFIPFIALSSILTSLLKCIKLYAIFEVPRLAVFGLPIVFIAILSSFGIKETDWLGVALFCGANVVVFAVYVYLTVLYVPFSYITTQPQYEWREWFGTAIPITFSHLFFVGTKQVDLFMVEALGAGESSVGYFSVASQTAQTIVLFYISLTLIYSPLISRSILQGNAIIKKLLLKMAGFVSGMCLFFLLFLFVFGKFILSLFGQDYLQAYPTMLLLAAGGSVNAVAGGYITFLQYTAKQNVVLAVQLVVLVLAITLNALLIPKFGIFGAGLSSAICFSLMSVILMLYAIRLLSKAS